VILRSLQVRFVLRLNSEVPIRTLEGLAKILLIFGGFILGFQVVVKVIISI
jgi:hypothetical protein